MSMPRNRHCSPKNFPFLRIPPTLFLLNFYPLSSIVPNSSFPILLPNQPNNGCHHSVSLTSLINHLLFLHCSNFQHSNLQGRNGLPQQPSPFLHLSPRPPPVFPPHPTPRHRHRHRRNPPRDHPQAFLRRSYLSRSSGVSEWRFL